jgi:hypothetical protein
MQNHYNLIYREEEREMLPLCREEGIGVIPWSPLARGFLAGNRRRPIAARRRARKTDDFAHELYYADADFTIADRAVDLAARRGVKPRRSRSRGCCEAGRHRADHRRLEAAAPRRGDRRPRGAPRAGGDRVSRESRTAAPHSRAPLTCFPETRSSRSGTATSADLDRSASSRFTGSTMQSAALLWHVSLLVPPERKGLALGVVGSVSVVPIVVFSMISGVVADALDRRG